MSLFQVSRSNLNENSAVDDVFLNCFFTIYFCLEGVVRSNTLLTCVYVENTV